jgi:ketosteroid isomerase-like protein
MAELEVTPVTPTICSQPRPRNAAAQSQKGDIGLSGLLRIVSAMTATTDKAHQFFERYAAALLARDEQAIARMYAVPSLILFPGRSIPVSDASQTEEFFAASWSQYDGVDAVDKQVVVMAEAPGSIWADVTWSYDGQPRERFCYQLVEGTDGYQIAVLTPMT